MKTKARLSHVDAGGRVKMVDVGEKPATRREAIAHGSIRMSREALALVRSGRVKKGDPLQAARLAGIMAAKQTSALIEARVSTTAQTGVEMEALTAVAVAALTVYDMVKAVDKRMVIGNVRLEYKSGGRSGVFTRAGKSSAAGRAGKACRAGR